MLDERDVRAGIFRRTLRVDEVMADINRARLEREHEEMAAKVDALIAKLGSVSGREYLAVSDSIDRLWKRMDENVEARLRRP